MLRCLSKFRYKLDEIMLMCMHKGVILFGTGYSAAFIKWYASYYHGIDVDYTIALDKKNGQPHEEVIFLKSLISLGYKNVKECVVWLSEPVPEELIIELEGWGYIYDRSLFSFPDHIFGNDKYWNDNENENVFQQHKTGMRCIQELEFLEWEFGCNFITAVSAENFDGVAKEHGSRFSSSQTMDIHMILSKCHIVPDINDWILDYGCGKGGALVSFLDYGFKNVGG